MNALARKRGLETAAMGQIRSATSIFKTAIAWDIV
jgi:hypothetical protein